MELGNNKGLPYTKLNKTVFLVSDILFYSSTSKHVLASYSSLKVINRGAELAGGEKLAELAGSRAPISVLS